MVIDIHGHLGNINFSQFWQADADRLAQYLRESGTDKLCLSASRAIMYNSSFFRRSQYGIHRISGIQQQKITHA